MAQREAPTSLLEYVKSLEGRDNRARGEQVLATLRAIGLQPRIQRCRLLRLRNLIVDFSPARARFLFSAHYDAVRGRPGANDNASGVAVLLGLCRELQHTSLPVRVVFFDREEAWLRTPLLRLGVLGSLYYVLRTGCRDLHAVINLEYCGSGDFLGIWPLKQGQADIPAVADVTRAATRLGIPFKLAHFPWLFFSSDHLPFRLRGMSNSLTLSLFPADQLPAVEKLLSGLSLTSLVSRHRPALPEPLSVVHTGADTSSRLNERSLQLMLSLVLEIAGHFPACYNENTWTDA